MSQDGRGLGGRSEGLPPLSAEHEEDCGQGEAPDARPADSDGWVNVTIPVMIHKALRRPHHQEYPTTVTITLRPDAGRQQPAAIGEPATPTMVPVSDEPLHRAIVSQTGKVARGYTSQKCSQCEHLGFRVCNKLFDQTCVFCRAAGTRCEFPPPRRTANSSRIEDTNFPREFLYDANRKMQRYIEGFAMPEGVSLHNRCGAIPEDLCVDSVRVVAGRQHSSFPL